MVRAIRRLMHGHSATAQSKLPLLSKQMREPMWKASSGNVFSRSRP